MMSSSPKTRGAPSRTTTRLVYALSTVNADMAHSIQVAQTRNIITSPALLESTSLVFAYGLDVFLTRVAPSSTFDILNKNFNKAQLVLTISGLAVGIFIAKPMVRRKRLRERWYN